MTDAQRDSNDGQYLDVGHLQSDLVRRSVRGGGVTIAAQSVKVVAQAAAIVVLARLLAPADFGLFAIVAAFLTLLELFKDLGLSTATIQSRELTLRQVSTLFWLNCALGVVVAGALAAIAPLLARIYDQPLLLEIAPAAAIAFLFTGAAAQHIALLRRQMRFGSVAKIQVGSEVIGLSVAVAAAFAGFGVWSLVMQRIAWAAAMTVAAWSICRWRPGRPGTLAEVRPFISFGGNATASMALGHLAGNLDKILIGWYWGAAPLGFYERAQKLQLLPVQNLNAPLATVAISALSRIADQSERYRTMYFAAVERLAMVIAPLGGLLVASADPLVALVLGSQWAETAAILRWMGAAMVYLPVTYALSWLYLSQGRTPEMLRASATNATLMIVTISAGLPFGPTGVAAAYVLSAALLRVPLLFWLAGRRGPVRTRDLWKATIMPAVAALAVCLVLLAVRHWSKIPSLPLPAYVATIVGLAIVVAILVYATFPAGRRAFRSGPKIIGMILNQAKPVSSAR